MQKLKDKIYTWGYVLDKLPSDAPFIFGKTKCSLETATNYLGAKKSFYRTQCSMKRISGNTSMPRMNAL